MLSVAVLSAVGAPARQPSVQLQAPPVPYKAADLGPPSVALGASQQSTGAPEGAPDPLAAQRAAEEAAAEALAQERDAMIAQRDADIQAGDGSGKNYNAIGQAEAVAQRDAEILAGDGSGTVGRAAQDAIDASVKVQADRAEAAAQAERDLADAAKRAAEAAEAALANPGAVAAAPSPEADAAAAQAVRDLEDAAKRSADAAQAALANPGVVAAAPDAAAPLPALSSPNAPTSDSAVPAPVPVAPALGGQAQASPSPGLDWASGLPLPPIPGGLADPATPAAAPAAAVGPNGEKIDWASGLPVPVETKQDQNLDCLSIQPGIPDMWCATRCVANGDCPPDTCKCGEGAREQGAAARAEAAKAWEDAENKRRADAEQKIDDPDKKYTDEPWKGNQQAAQAMDNWKEAEARVKSASAGTAYPDGLPPADEDIKEHEEDSFENAEDIPMDKSCVSVGSFKSDANDYYCATSCAPGSRQPCSETICKCGDEPSARRR